MGEERAALNVEEEGGTVFFFHIFLSLCVVFFLRVRLTVRDVSLRSDEFFFFGEQT